MFGDHTFYVWTSYALAAVILAWQGWQPIMRMRRIRARLTEELGKHDPNA